MNRIFEHRLSCILLGVSFGGLGLFLFFNEIRIHGSLFLLLSMAYITHSLISAGSIHRFIIEEDKKIERNRNKSVLWRKAGVFEFLLAVLSIGGIVSVVYYYLYMKKWTKSTTRRLTQSVPAARVPIESARRSKKHEDTYSPMLTDYRDSWIVIVFANCSLLLGNVVGIRWSANA